MVRLRFRLPTFQDFQAFLDKGMRSALGSQNPEQILSEWFIREILEDGASDLDAVYTRSPIHVVATGRRVIATADSSKLLTVAPYRLSYRIPAGDWTEFPREKQPQTIGGSYQMEFFLVKYPV